MNTLEDIYFKTDYLTKQNNDEASYCYKIKKKDTYINFSQTASEVYGKIRAFSPVPGAKCFVNGELLKVLEAKIEDSFEKHKNHSLVLDNNLLISCGTGSIRLTKVQRQGKKVMSAKDILNGWNIEKGVIFNEETQN